MRHLLAASIACALALTGFATPNLGAEELTIGDNAPKLEVKEFVKGEPITKLEPGSVYVVEFWATWCGPCRAAMPHLTELQKKYPEVKFIGVSVWEQSQDSVVPFVEEMGDKIGYRVAMDLIPKDGDGNDGAMAKNWLKAADLNGIPASFVVGKDLKVAWIGHPGKIDEPLEKIVQGKWSIEEALAERKKEAEKQEKMQQLSAKLQAAVKTGELKNIVAALDNAAKEMPELALPLSFTKFQFVLNAGEEAQAIEIGKQWLTESNAEVVDPLNRIAWNVVDEQDNPSKEMLAFALDCAKRADELEQGKNPGIADTLARAQFKSGDAKQAVKTQQRAIELAKGTELEKESHGLQERLEEYQKAAEKK